MGTRYLEAAKSFGFCTQNERNHRSHGARERLDVLQEWGTRGTDLAVSVVENQVENPQVNSAVKQRDGRQIQIL